MPISQSARLEPILLFHLILAGEYGRKVEVSHKEKAYRQLVNFLLTKQSEACRQKISDLAEVYWLFIQRGGYIREKWGKRSGAKFIYFNLADLTKDQQQILEAHGSVLMMIKALWLILWNFFGVPVKDQVQANLFFSENLSRNGLEEILAGEFRRVRDLSMFCLLFKLRQAQGLGQATAMPFGGSHKVSSGRVCLELSR